jgi:hypothetical protein
MKICSKCKIEKEIILFPKNRSYCKLCANQMCKDYKQKNKEKIQEYNKNYKESHKNEIKEYNKQYNTNNRQSIQERQTKQHKLRRQNDIEYKISINLRNRIKKLINRKSLKTKELLGCTVEELEKWLEYNFYGEMSWENYGNLWHIDHVIPCSMFDLTNIEHQKICFHWSNIRPLYAIDNLIKNNILFWSDMHNYYIKLNYYSKINNIDISEYSLFIKKLKYTKSNVKRVGWHLGNQDGIVKII